MFSQSSLFGKVQHTHSTVHGKELALYEKFDNYVKCAAHDMQLLFTELQLVRVSAGTCLSAQC